MLGPTRTNTWLLVACGLALSSSSVLAQDATSGVGAAATEPVEATTTEDLADASAPSVETSHAAPEAAPPEDAPEAASVDGVEPAPVDDDEPVAPSPPADDEFGIRATVELGFLAVLAHEIQLGLDGTRLDYPSDFSQSNLYLFTRISADVDIWRQHILTFVYQPIDLETRSSVPRDVRIDGLDFARGTAVRARYGFPFYRFGWAFDVLPAANEELAFGIGLQIRNAAIEFQSGDGTLYRARNDVGPVPLLRARGRFALPSSWFFAFDVDGFYAFIPGINGSDNNVEGAILDLSLRLGWRFMPHVDAFFSARYIGGGAAGQGDATATSDGFQRNWLHFLSLSLGVTLDSRR